MTENLMPVTMIAAGILGLVYFVLSANVVAARVRTKTMLGDGGDARMEVAIRAHGNFMEYVPLLLMLIGALEFTGGPHWLVLGLAVVLVVARVMHPFGLLRPAPNVMRAGGALLTFSVLLVASVALLVRMLAY
jgi:uncharacterized membrane protein YecN with MAPEG domain